MKRFRVFGVKQILACLIIVVIQSIYSFSFAQERTLKPSKFNQVLKTTSKNFKIATIENGQVATMDTVQEAQIRIKPNQLKEIQISDHIQKADVSSKAFFGNQLVDASSVNTEKMPADYNIIPELYVLSGNNEAEDLEFYVLFTSEFPLQYDFSRDSFTGSVGFILLSESAADSRSLSSKNILLEVASADIEEISPSTIEIDHLSLPSSEIVLADKSLQDSAAIRIRTKLNPEGYLSYIPVETPLQLTTQRPSVQGYGIQEIPIEVSLAGKGSGETKVQFEFKEGMGSISPNSIVLNNNESKTIRVRSEGQGKVQLAAFTNNFNSNVIEFEYIFPSTFLILTLIGGVIGASIKYRKGTKKFSIGTFAVGILVGFMAVGLWYVLGVNILSISLPDFYNEGAVLLISALGAWGIGLKV